MRYLALLIGWMAFATGLQAQVLGGTHAAPSEKEQPKKMIAYRQPGAVTLHFSNYISHLHGVVSMPINLQPEVTVCKNFTVGPIFSYLQKKNTEEISETVTRINDGNVTYQHFTVGLKGSYHLLPLVQKAVRKPMLVDYVDVYVSAWGGYGFAFSHKSAASDLYMQANRTLRGGASIGVRSMVLPRFGFFAEGGYGSFGYLSFGLTTRIR
ncbi:MAG: hypothetical protein SFW35_00010 [Chitinophagales bacterium]|nr:hypothetical protein [Chitinophagales bacterium]